LIVLSPDEMASLDKKVINRGFPSLLLMETAGRRTAEIIKGKYSREQKILILSGPGNNGGDGLVVGRILDIWDYDVKIIVVGKLDKLNDDPRKNLKICQLRSMKIEFLPADIDLSDLKNNILEYDVMVDSLLGNGLTGQLREPYLQIVKMINSSGKNVLSVDIPTGVNGSNGKIMGEAVRAETTVTMAYSKVGQFIYPGREYIGELIVIDLGFPKNLVNFNMYNHYTLTSNEAKRLLPKREVTGHKGTFGKILILGGSLGYEGAPVLTGKSALKMGSGLVKILTPVDVYQTVSCYCEEITGDYLTIEKFEEAVKDFNVVALGPGLGVGDFQKKLVNTVLKKASIPLVIDADGINNLDLEILKEADNQIVLTPHPGEFSNLIDEPIPDVLANRIKYVRDFATQYGVNIVLKGASSIISDREGNVYINTTGNNGLATAGSGDVLTGIISSLSGQKLNIYKSAVLGTYIHGLAGDLAEQKLGSYSMIAKDIIENIAPAISKILRRCKE